MARKPNPTLIDQDAPEMTDEQLAAMRPASEVLPPDLYERLAQRKPGRPRSPRPKVSITLRVDPDVLDAYKSGGPGWQTRMHAALRDRIAPSATEPGRSRAKG